MSKHTPGPWDLVTRLREGRTNGSYLQWTVRSEHIEAADEIDRLRSVNADLLEALKAIFSEHSVRAMRAAERAIAKAKGDNHE